MHQSWHPCPKVILFVAKSLTSRRRMLGALLVPAPEPRILSLVFVSLTEDYAPRGTYSLDLESSCGTYSNIPLVSGRVGSVRSSYDCLDPGCVDSVAYFYRHPAVITTRRLLSRWPLIHPAHLGMRLCVWNGVQYWGAFAALRHSVVLDFSGFLQQIPIVRTKRKRHKCRAPLKAEFC